MTTQEDKDRWIQEARKRGCGYVLVVCDTFSYEDYPIYCWDALELEKQRKAHDDVDMQKIMEVIDVN